MKGIFILLDSLTSGKYPTLKQGLHDIRSLVYILHTIDLLFEHKSACIQWYSGVMF